ncbi:MAG: hypothetical protein HY433_03300 [Candidatus Liptonbacteria bacterium]|nr:hypothetical protein [Candidatus Liptonbacteria bacterium]
MRANKFLASLLLLLTAVLLQYNFNAFLGWSPDFVLGVLVTFPFFLGFIEILFMGLAGALILNWQPQFSSEILMISTMPLFVLFVKKYFPWRAGLSHILSTFFMLAVFYGISDYASLFGNPALFLKSAAWTLAYGALVFQALNYFYPPSQRFGARPPQ